MYYVNLNAEIARCGISKRVLAERIGMRYGTLITKMAGKAPFTIEEARTITKQFEGCTIDYLFDWKE